jgi:hypothetical protein
VKNEHAQRKAKCMKLFQTMMGASPKAIIRSDLLAGRFRSAFLTLYMHYNSGIGGIQTLLICYASRTSSGMLWELVDSVAKQLVVLRVSY